MSGQIFSAKQLRTRSFGSAKVDARYRINGAIHPTHCKPATPNRQVLSLAYSFSPLKLPPPGCPALLVIYTHKPLLFPSRFCLTGYIKLSSQTSGEGLGIAGEHCQLTDWLELVGGSGWKGW